MMFADKIYFGAMVAFLTGGLLWLAFVRGEHRENGAWGAAVGGMGLLVGVIELFMGQH
jgi:hypothetical protein